MLQASYTSVLNAVSREEFRGEVVRFGQGLGFDTVAAIAVIDHPASESEFIAVDNTPQAFLDSWDDVALGKHDPVMQHVKRSSVPIVWSQRTYTDAGVAERWEHQASFGYHTGICLALHLPEGRHFVLGVDRHDPLPKDAPSLTRLVADLQLFAVHAQDTALRILAPEIIEAERPGLTPRELDSLRWTMEGKTAWEVGSILGISERTAVLHIQNAMKKLGSVSKHQAVLKALRLGLIR